MRVMVIVKATVDSENEPAPIDMEKNAEMFAAMGKFNDELVKGYPTEVVYLARETALQDPDLIRTKVNLIPEWVQEIRVVDIVGLDRQADGGTHVRSTLEVGRVRVVKTESKGKANKRMRIELD